MKITFISLCLWAVSILSAQQSMLYYSANGNASVDAGSNQVSGNYTVEFWFRTSSSSATPQIFSVLNLDNYSTIFDIGLDAGTSYYVRAGNTTHRPSVAFSENTWHHIAYVATPERYVQYFDGNIVASGMNLNTTTLFQAGNQIKIGGLWNWFYGYLDEIRVWNTARTTAEIRSNMLRTLSGTENGLKLYYDCQETSGTTLHDRTSNGLNAELTGTVEFSSIAFPSTMVYQGYTSDMTATSSVLRGSYYPNNSASRCYFEYGATSAYGSASPVQIIDQCDTLIDFTHALTGLSPQTAYHFRSVFIIGTDTTRTDDAVFTTNALAPTTQASGVTVTGIDPGDVTVQWTNGNGQKRIVLLREGAPVNADPVTSFVYEASAAFAEGTAVASGVYVVHAGSENSVTVSGLKQGTTYHVAVYEYNDGNGAASPAYLLPGAAASGSTTTLDAPTVPANAITFLDTTAATCRVRVNKGNGNGRVMVVKEGRYNTTLPENDRFYEGGGKGGSYYSGDSFDEYDSAYVVLAEDDSVVTFSALSEKTTYIVSVFEYNSFGNSLIQYNMTIVSDTITTKPHMLATTASRPTNITSSGATFHGTLYTNNVMSDAYFWYDTTTGTYGKETILQEDFYGDGLFPYSQAVTGLTGSTLYYLQARGQNDDARTSTSNTVAFMTYASSELAFGSALKYDGADDYASTSVPVSAIDNITIEARVRWNGATAGSQCILYNGDPSYNGYGLFLFHTNGFKISVLAGGVTDVYANATLPIDTWTHIALVRSSGIWTLYIDGVATPLTYNNFSPNYAAGNFHVGGILGGNSFNGAIDEVRIWNTARTSTEIGSAASSCFTSAQSGLAGYWQFNENKGSKVYDLAGSNDLTLGNFSFDAADGWMSNEAALPVELTTFSAIPRHSNVELRWSTASETNNHGFEVERKPEISNAKWNRIAFVDGAGTSNSTHEYSYIDRSLSAGTYTFRLKQIDRDGKIEYSNEVEVTIAAAPAKFTLEQNYPNPFNPSTTIGFTLQVSGMTTLNVYDAIGREVATLADEHLEAGVYHQRTFDASELSSGIYIVRLTGGGQSQVRKINLIK